MKTFRQPAVGLVLRLLSLALATIFVARVAVAQDLTRGGNVQPAYEGWEKNSDGSYTMYFGYFNRNWEEEPNVPIGPNNFFSPGPEDQGQPTHFYPKRQMILFKIRVPADFGKKELIWTVTHNGRTDKAVGWLAPFYEFDNTVLRAQRGGSQRESTPEELQAKPPTIEAEGGLTATATANAPLTLAVLVRDDGLPGPAKRRFPDGGESSESVAVIGTLRKKNAPLQDMVSAASAAKTGLAVTFLHYRGPGQVTFEPMTVPLDKMGGRAQTSVRFSESGTYVIRAVANDQIFTTPVNITVTVTDGGAPRTAQQP